MRKAVAGTLPSEYLPVRIPSRRNTTIRIYAGTFGSAILGALSQLINDGPHDLVSVAVEVAAPAGTERVNQDQAAPADVITV